MNAETMKSLFDEYDHEYLQFDCVEPKLSTRPDLHAFLLLDRLVPGTEDIVAAAEHDEIWLNIDCKKLREVITEGDIVTLTRCGIRYDSDNDSLASFV